MSDVTQAQATSAQQSAVLDRIESGHLIRRHAALALADGTLALVVDQATGGSFAELLRARGQLTPGETVTSVAPLFGALAELHDVGVVHGNLTPGNVSFSADGRPLIGELGVAGLLGLDPGPLDGTSGFVAPELVGGAAISAASDVYAMAALGWFCLTGAPPEPAPTCQTLVMLSPKTTPRLAEVLVSCLSVDPKARPSARAAAIGVFDADSAESVALASVGDPAAEITRRIRVGALAESTPAPRRIGKSGPGYREPLVIGVLVALLAVSTGAGVSWFLRRPPVAVARVAASATAPSEATRAANTAKGATQRATTEVVTAKDSPRLAPAELLQALADARALAYAVRSPALLDLVYAPGSERAKVDSANIAKAVSKGGTYLGLSYVIKGAAFLDGTPSTARVRATILTPGYQTGQPDGRKVPHAQDLLGPCVFTLSLTPDGWRVLALTTS